MNVANKDIWQLEGSKPTIYVYTQVNANLIRENWFEINIFVKESIKNTEKLYMSV